MFTMDQIDATHTAYKMGIEAGREVSATRIAELEKALNYFLDRDEDKPQNWKYRRDKAERLARDAMEGGIHE
jgi:hypothetical protein